MPVEQMGFVGRMKHRPVIDFGLKVSGVVTDKNLSGYAQMMAYNILFATAPLLMVVTAGAAAITRAVNKDLENPAEPVLEWMYQHLPAEVAGFLKGPIESALNQSSGWIFSIGALLALWGARAAIGAIIRGLNVAYGIDKDPRNIVIKNAIPVVLAIAIVLLVAVSGIVFTLGTSIGDDIASSIGMERAFARISYIARWPVIAIVGLAVVVLVHRFGPANSRPLRWYFPGAIFTVLGVYVVTAGMAFWFSMGGGFSRAYGVFGSVLAFIFWLYLMGFVILLGGAINAVAHSGQEYYR